MRPWSNYHLKKPHRLFGRLPKKTSQALHGTVQRPEPRTASGPPKPFGAPRGCLLHLYCETGPKPFGAPRGGLLHLYCENSPTPFGAPRGGLLHLYCAVLPLGAMVRARAGGWRGVGVGVTHVAKAKNLTNVCEELSFQLDIPARNPPPVSKAKGCYTRCDDLISK